MNPDMPSTLPGDPLFGEIIGKVAAAAFDRIDQEWRGMSDPRWIPVTERLPDYSDTVWAFDGADVVLCEHWIGSGFESLGSSCDREGLNSERLHGITHWMDVAYPVPPEVK